MKFFRTMNEGVGNLRYPRNESMSFNNSMSISYTWIVTRKEVPNKGRIKNYFRKSGFHKKHWPVLQRTAAPAGQPVVTDSDSDNFSILWAAPSGCSSAMWPLRDTCNIIPPCPEYPYCLFLSPCDRNASTYLEQYCFTVWGLLFYLLVGSF